MPLYPSRNKFQVPFSISGSASAVNGSTYNILSFESSSGLIVVPSFAKSIRIGASIMFTTNPVAQTFALKVIQGSKELAIIDWYQDILNKLDYTEFFEKPIILKGCSKKEVPNEVYTLAIQKLMKVAKSIMFGEACSAVPLYKKK